MLMCHTENLGSQNCSDKTMCAYMHMHVHEWMAVDWLSCFTLPSGARAPQVPTQFSFDGQRLSEHNEGKVWNWPCHPWNSRDSGRELWGKSWAQIDHQVLLEGGGSSVPLGGRLLPTYFAMETYPNLLCIVLRPGHCHTVTVNSLRACACDPSTWSCPLKNKEQNEQMPTSERALRWTSQGYRSPGKPLGTL